MSETTTRRTDSVRVKLAPEMLQRMEKMAALYGMPVATLAAFAVAEWLSGKENALALSRMAVMDIGRKVGGQMEALIAEAVASGEMDEAVVQMTTRKLPLDGVSPEKGE